MQWRADVEQHPPQGAWADQTHKRRVKRETPLAQHKTTETMSEQLASQQTVIKSDGIDPRGRPSGYQEHAGRAWN